VGDRAHWARIAPAWRWAADAFPTSITPPSWDHNFDQIALGVACARLGIDVELLPPRLNFPFHQNPLGPREIQPVLPHHYQTLESRTPALPARACPVPRGAERRQPGQPHPRPTRLECVRALMPGPRPPWASRALRDRERSPSASCSTPWPGRRPQDDQRFELCNRRCGGIRGIVRVDPRMAKSRIRPSASPSAQLERLAVVQPSRPGSSVASRQPNGSSVVLSPR
jgi:hypothetical protein